MDAMLIAVLANQYFDEVRQCSVLAVRSQANQFLQLGRDPKVEGFCLSFHRDVQRLSSANVTLLHAVNELLKAVDEQRVRTKALRVIETAKGPVKCPRCTFDRVVKNGHARGLQRYRCVGCNKTFNATTGTPLAGLRHMERFLQQGDCLAKGMTVREAAGVMGVSLTRRSRP